MCTTIVEKFKTKLDLWRERDSSLLEGGLLLLIMSLVVFMSSYFCSIKFRCKLGKKFIRFVRGFFEEVQRRNQRFIRLNGRLFANLKSMVVLVLKA